MTPESVYRLTAEMASFHARALDEIGSLYYTREGYDDFYAGKGSTYPDLNGGVGILFEQASVRGHRQESENGTLTFPFAIRNQVVSSLSTLRAALELRSRLLAHQRMFFKSALVEADRTPVRAYVFSAPGDPVRAYHFLDLLHQHGIKAYALSRQVRIGEQDFLPGESYLVPTQQPQYRLITSIFETQTSFTDSLFYDVSTWTLPPAFHLSFAAYRSKTLPAELLGQRADRPVFPQGTVRGAANAYAYVFSWDAYYAPRALYRLLKSGVQAKVATHPFEARIDSGGQRFGYGTVMIPAGGKDGLLRARMDSVARLDGVQVFALETGLSMRGIDVGSPSFEPVVRPRVMVAVGEGVSASEAGESWYVLERRFDMDVSLVETGRFRSVVLNRYTCVVLPSGSYRTVDSTGVAALARWVEDGGTLILQGEAVEWGLKRKLANGKLKSLQTPVKDERRAYADATRDLGAQKIGGVILEVQIDPSHPMGYGYAESRVAVFRQGTVFLEPSENPYATPLQYTDFPLVSGYLSANNEALLRMVSGRGRGRVILMPDSPMFRSFWYGTDKLLLNGIFFGRMIQPETTERVKVGSR